MVDDDWVPLIMGPKLIGKAKINLENGEIEGKLDPEFAHILDEGFRGGLASVSFSGNAGHPVKLQQDLKIYLEGDENGQEGDSN